MISDKQIKLIHTLISRCGLDKDEIKRKLNITSFKELTKEKASWVIEKLQKTDYNTATDTQKGRIKHLFNTLYPQKSLKEYLKALNIRKDFEYLSKKEASNIIHRLEKIEVWRKEKAIKNKYLKKMIEVFDDKTRLEVNKLLTAIGDNKINEYLKKDIQYLIKLLKNCDKTKENKLQQIEWDMIIELESV